MKFSVRIYAEALAKALDNKTKEEQKHAAEKLRQILIKNRDRQKLNQILAETEKIILKRAGAAKVLLEAAEPVSDKIKRQIKESVNKKVFFKEDVKPELLAGIKILINDELLIDASAKSRLNKIF